MENKLQAIILVVTALGLGAWFIGQSWLPQPQADVTNEYFKEPIKSSLSNDVEAKVGVGYGAITLQESTDLVASVNEIQPLNSQPKSITTESSKNFNQAKRDSQLEVVAVRRFSRLDQLSHQYGLQFLPDSILGYADEEAVLKTSRRFIERQLAIKSDDAQLVELAQQAGVNEALILKFRSQSIRLDTRLPASRGSLLPAKLQPAIPDGRRSVNSHQQHLLKQHPSSNQYQSLKPGHAALDGSRPSQQGRGAGQKKVIDPVVESLRRSLIANTSNSLAKLQLKQLGLTN